MRLVKFTPTLALHYNGHHPPVAAPPSASGAALPPYIRRVTP